MVTRVFSLTGKFMQVFAPRTAAANIGLTVPNVAVLLFLQLLPTANVHIGHSRVGKRLAEAIGCCDGGIVF